MKKARLAGFTMIELLVVIAIIGVLAVVALSGINPVKQLQRARDTRRKAALKQVQNAFEQYYAENNSQYSTECKAMGADLKTGLPDEGTRYTYGCNSLTTYCACVELDRGNGNSTDGNCSFVNDASGDFFCIANLQ